MEGLTTHFRPIYYLYILIRMWGGSMKTVIPISDARRQLPRLVRRLQRDPGTIYTITVRNEAVAELRAAPPGPEPGAAARKLLEIIARIPKPRRKTRTNISTRVKQHLYGKGGVIK
jgi:antitoxin (DNA-binding transcriptional repressor) of toxin-antitoxin stability system